MRIIFMGTPDFAVPSLAILHEAGHTISAVITAPDRPAGRGRKLQKSAVKQYAESQGLLVLQPEKLKNPEFLAQVQGLDAELAVVVAFRMLPKVVWSIPKLGTFNLHASLLPDYRGAAPINWALINGETRSGATTFFIDRKIDTGNILLQEELAIPTAWNAGNLHDALMELGAGLVLRTVQGLEAGTLEARPQDESMYQHSAPKIFKEDCKIDWTQPAEKTYNFVRGLSPYPTAWTAINEKMVKIYALSISESCEGIAPGTIEVVDNQRLRIATADQWLEVHHLQFPGKKRVAIADFLRGNKEVLQQAN